MRNKLLLGLILGFGIAAAGYADPAVDDDSNFFSPSNLQSDIPITACPAPAVAATDLPLGQELANFLPSLFDTQQWPARWNCGTWSPFLGWLYIVSDFLIWVAYFTIPVILLSFVYRRGSEVPFRTIFLWFIGFILACGLTHLVDAAIFWWPAYRLSASIKFITAFVSLGTVFALTKVMPRAMELRSPEALERIVKQRTAELRQVNEQLAHEISQRRLAEEAVRESEARLLQLIESLPQLVWTCQPDGHCDYLSQQWLAYTGIPEEEQLGYGWLEQVHPEDRDATAQNWTKAVETDSDFRVEFRIRNHQGEYRWFDTIARRLYDSEGNMVKWFGTNTDIEEKKKSVIQIQQLNNQLEKRVKERTAQLESANQELESFSYSVSHDLRAPLRHIQNYSTVMLEDYQDQLDEGGCRILHKMKSRALTMERLIDDLLEFSRMSRQDINKQPIDMAQLVESVFQDQQALEPERRVVFTLQSVDNAPGDYPMLKQVWNNLISNAIKYTQHTANPTVEVGSSTRPEEVMYYIKDNGAGFDMKYADKLFRVFERLHKTRDFEGTGVGLALVKRIIERHGGRIWVEAEENRGATFYFTLPTV